MKKLTFFLLGSLLCAAPGFAQSARRFIRVTSADQLQSGRQYTMGTIRPSTVAVPSAAGDCWPRFLKLNASNQALLEVHHDVTTFGSEYVWTFTADATRDCGIAHNDKSTFYTLKNGDRYVTFNNEGTSLATVEESGIHANNYGEFIPVNSPTDMGFVFKVHYNRGTTAATNNYRTLGVLNDGSFSQFSASSASSINTISLENAAWTAAWQLYWVVDESQFEDVEAVARAMWAEKLQKFTIENVGMEYTAEELAAHFPFPESTGWSYETLDRQIEEAWNAGVPKTSLVRVTCDDMLVAGMKYVFYCVGEHESFPQAYYLGSTLSAGKLPETGNITPYIWTFHAPGNSTPSTYEHDGYAPGKIFAMSNGGRYARFNNATPTATYSYANDFELPHSSIHTIKGETSLYYNLCTDRASVSGNFNKTRGMSIAANGTVTAVGGAFSMSTTSYIDQCNFYNNNITYSTVHSLDLVIHSWYLDEVAPLLWAAKRAAVNSGDFSDEVKAQILEATATMPEHSLAFETLQSDIDNLFNQAVSSVLAANLASMANEMVDSHFAELKAWSGHCSDNDIVAAVNALIERVKGEITLSADRDWTTDEILEYVNGKYTELGVMTLEDEFTAILAGKTLNIVSANTTADNTYLQLSTAKNQLVGSDAAYTTLDFEKVEGGTAMRIREVCTGLYLGVAPISNSQAIPLTADVNAAGLWRVLPVNATEGEELRIYPDGITNRYLYCNAGSGNTLVMDIQDSAEGRWTLKSASKLDGFNTALGAVAAENVAKVTEYSTYGTAAFLTTEAINGASEVYSNPFTADDELTPTAFTARVAEYNTPINELWSQSVINGKELILNVSRTAAANQFLEVNAQGNMTTTTGDLHAKNVWKFIHEDNDLFHIYNVESGKYIRNNNGTPALTDDLEAAGSFRFAKPVESSANIENAIFLEDNSLRNAGNKYLHLTTSNSIIYWKSGGACIFKAKFTDEDVAAAAKLPCGFNIPDVSGCKTTDDEGYAIGGYDAGLKAEVVAASAAVTTYIDENVGNVELTALLNGRDELLTVAAEAATAFEASKSMPQSGMYITLTSSPGNSIQGATLFDNGNERDNNTTVSTGENYLRLSATEAHPITEFNKIWLYKDGKMYNYGTGHHLEGENTSGSAKRHLGMSTAPTANEEAAAAAAAEISFVNAYNEKNEFQLIHASTRSVHIAAGPVANTCGVANNTTVKNEVTHNWHIGLVTELPVKIGQDGKGSLIAPVAVTVPAGSDDFTFYIASTDGNNNLIFDDVEAGSTISANTPIVIQRSTGTATVCNAPVNYNPVDAPATLTAETESNDRFFGSYLALTAPAAGENEVIYVKSATVDCSKPEDVVFSKVEPGSTIPAGTIAFKAVKDSAEDAPATMTLNLGAANSGTTSINSIYVENEHDAAESVIYDLQGRRLASPVRGINIINGKKILVK